MNNNIIKLSPFDIYTDIENSTVMEIPIMDHDSSDIDVMDINYDDIVNIYNIEKSNIENSIISIESFLKVIKFKKLMLLQTIIYNNDKLNAANLASQLLLDDINPAGYKLKRFIIIILCNKWNPDPRTIKKTIYSENDWNIYYQFYELSLFYGRKKSISILAAKLNSTFDSIKAILKRVEEIYDVKGIITKNRYKYYYLLLEHIKNNIEKIKIMFYNNYSFPNYGNCEILYKVTSMLPDTNHKNK